MADKKSELREIEVKGSWRNIFSQTNNTSIPVKVTCKYTSGLKSVETDERTVTVKTSVDVGLQIGTKIKIIELGIDFSVHHESSSEVRSIKEVEIHRTAEHSFEFEIPPGKQFAIWQFVADVVGNEYQYHQTVSVMDDKVPAPPKVSKAIIEMRKEIKYGSTSIRIRHAVRNRFITVVSRKDWPAATLGHSDQFHFKLHKAGNEIKIEALNTTSAGYTMLYSSDQGGIYFDQWSDNEKQFWRVSKSDPLRDGDVVSFQNKCFSDSFLCYHDGPATDVYCLARNEDLWMLEVV